MINMSWQKNWPPMQQQHLTPAYPPPIASVAPLASIAPVADYGALNADQYKQWQWQQYSMQYAQWHAQYGEQYARETGKSLPPVATPANQMQPMSTLSANYAADNSSAGTSFAELNLVAPPPPAEPHPDELNLSNGQDKPPLPEEKSAEELAFDEQFRKWEQEFETWKRKNRNHPDKLAYREYEQKCMSCRKKLLERREQLRQTRIEQNAVLQEITSGLLQHPSFATCPTESLLPASPNGPPNGSGSGDKASGISRRKNNDNADRSLRLDNVFSQSSSNGDGRGGIPGLDLIDEHPPPLPKKIKLEKEVVEVIDLANNDEDVKPETIQVNNTANAISSLLSDPKVNALLQLVGSTIACSSGNGKTPRATASMTGETSTLAEALAQLTNGKMENLVLENQNQDIIKHCPNGTTEWNDERRNIVSPHTSACPVSRTVMAKGNSVNSSIQDFNPRIPPPSFDIDLSRPPPAILMKKRQQNDHWSSNHDQLLQNRSSGSTYSAEGSPIAKLARYDRPPPTVETHAEANQIDPELGRPVAVPKPDWMTEEEYQDIYDRYEHVLSFEERKNKMELAIHLLRQRKIRAGKIVSKDKPNCVRSGMPHPLPNVKAEIDSESADEFFQPQQVFDYTNYRQPSDMSLNQQATTGRVIDYGHCGATQYNSSDPNDRLNSRRGGFRKSFNSGIGHEFRPQTQRYDYNHSRVASIATKASSKEQEKTHWSLEKQFLTDDRSLPGLERLAQMHLNPNPDESNPNYPSKFLLMNDNRPTCLSTKRGKRPSSIRKQKLRQQLQQQQQLSQLNEPETRVTQAVLCKQEPVLDLEDLSSDDDAVEGRIDAVDSTEEVVKEIKREPQDEGPASGVTSQSSQNHPPASMIDIEDILFPPGRFSRPPRICLLVRGLPGSGKSFLARLIKNKEQAFGASPRVLSLDDYFLIDKEEEFKDPLTGKVTKISRSQYEFDGEMEEIYIQNLLKAFKRTISERLFNFVIVDCCNHRLEYYCEFHNYGRSNGFKVYTCTMQTDVEVCARQNIHNRTLIDIQAYADSWAMAPDEHVQVHFTALLQSDQLDKDTTETNMELTAPEEGLNTEVENNQATLNDKGNDDSADSSGECDLFASKWDNDASEQNLARLDGISKPLKRPPTIEDYLQLDDIINEDGVGPDRKKKRVRWADVEERQAQTKMRQMGFVVGVTDWSRMMDPSQGSSALTQTKYIARVKKQT